MNKALCNLSNVFNLRKIFFLIFFVQIFLFINAEVDNNDVESIMMKLGDEQNETTSSKNSSTAFSALDEIGTSSNIESSVNQIDPVTTYVPYISKADDFVKQSVHTSGPEIASTVSPYQSVVKSNIGVINSLMDVSFSNNVKEYSSSWGSTNVSVVDLYPLDTFDAEKYAIEDNVIEFRINETLSKSMKKKIQEEVDLERSIITKLGEAAIRSVKSYVFDVRGTLVEGDSGAYVKVNGDKHQVLCDKHDWSAEVFVNEVKSNLEYSPNNMPIQLIMMDEQANINKLYGPWVQFSFIDQKINNLVNDGKISLPSYFPIKSIYPEAKSELEGLEKLRGYLVCFSTGDPVRFFKKTSVINEVTDIVGNPSVRVKEVVIQKSKVNYTAFVTLESIYDRFGKFPSINKINLMMYGDLYDFELLRETSLKGNVCELKQELNEENKKFFRLVCPQVFITYRKEDRYHFLKRLATGTTYTSFISLMTFLLFKVTEVDGQRRSLLLKLPIYHIFPRILDMFIDTGREFSFSNRNVLYGLDYYAILFLFSHLTVLASAVGGAIGVKKLFHRLIRRMYFSRKSKQYVKQTLDDLSKGVGTLKKRVILLLRSSKKT